MSPCATTLEKRNEAKENTWKEMSPSATLRLAMQSVSSTRENDGSLGFQARPTKTARVKRELTFMIPSSAVTWMLVAVLGTFAFVLIFFPTLLSEDDEYLRSGGVLEIRGGGLREGRTQESTP